MGWDGDSYQQHFDEREAAGLDVHGEASFVLAIDPPPRSVLDAGCGTGRVAIELARQGVDVVGVDLDPSMLDTARRRAPSLEWIHADLTELSLRKRFDAVVMAGNVLLFTTPGSEAAVVGACARHLGPERALVAGFQLDRQYGLDAYDRDCAAAGLAPAGRWATWDRRPYSVDDDYVVSMHRKAT